MLLQGYSLVTIYVVRYPFKSYGQCFAAGTVITDISKVKHFKCRIGTHIIALDRKDPQTIPTIKFLESKLGVPTILSEVKEYLKAVDAAIASEGIVSEQCEVASEDEDRATTDTPAEQ